MKRDLYSEIKEGFEQMINDIKASDRKKYSKFLHDLYQLEIDGVDLMLLLNLQFEELTKRECTDIVISWLNGEY